MLNVWTIYDHRIKSRGNTTRDAVLRREQQMLRNKLPDNLSYMTVSIDGIEQNLAVINSDDMSTKYLHSLPNEDITHGGLVYFEDCYWLVTEKDVKDEVYTSAKMERCNHLLKWITSDGVIHEQWCIVEDGTKLKRVLPRNSLAYRKRYVKTTPLIAGIPLELYCYNVMMKYTYA